MVSTIEVRAGHDYTDAGPGKRICEAQRVALGISGSGLSIGIGQMSFQPYVAIRICHDSLDECIRPAKALCRDESPEQSHNCNQSGVMFFFFRI